MLSPKMMMKNPPEGIELAELRDSIRVLSEVIRQLAERVELLETRETLGRFRASGRSKTPRGF